MTRDNVLFALMGLLIGFVAAYFVYETVGENQPPRLSAGQVAEAPVEQGGAPANTGQGTDMAAAQQQVRQLEAFLEENPNDPQGWLQLANLSFDMQAWPRAAGAYERYFTLVDEEQPDVLSDYGVSLHRVGRPEDALEVFDRVQEIEPGHWQSRFNEVVVLAFDLGRFDEAEGVMQELEELQPENPDVRRLATELERRRGAA